MFLNSTENTTEDQKKWAEAAFFCLEMEEEEGWNGNKIAAEWWNNQYKACYSRVQRNVPYREK